MVDSKGLVNYARVTRPRRMTTLNVVISDDQNRMTYDPAVPNMVMYTQCIFEISVGIILL